LVEPDVADSEVTFNEPVLDGADSGRITADTLDWADTVPTTGELAEAAGCGDSGKCCVASVACPIWGGSPVLAFAAPPGTANAKATKAAAPAAAYAVIRIRFI
jgi:hypothetical protein